MNSALQIIIISFFFPIFNLQSIEPDEVLKDEKLETRARTISKQLRCLVCQNEDIDHSNADIAKDLRIIIREKLTEGNSNKEILNFIHNKFGDFVLYKPPVRTDTILLWVTPFFLIYLFYFLFFRKK
ncbi:MAG: hypothetical protein CMM91_00625 [Rickettsiales bacterium]|nr:hypothetical protein [Rickettsiales bacterium]OUV54909.1 MAG: hypothetical protein CBC87_00130 [Rickettsiales bacterium TMED127]|tara:strand:- start:21662 stop:22042 length:381 start_codon:yes stop_codon:yes gene_type:complete